MMEKDFIKFLGTAGARFVVAKQLRSSAGVFLRINNKNIILDPGPGTIARLASSRPKIDVTRLDAIILTHPHIDHSNDVNILIDAMTYGGINKKGILYATEDALNGDNAVVLKYLRGFLKDIVILKENQHYQMDGLKFGTSLRHLHPIETLGIIFDSKGKKTGFMVDTGYSEHLLQSYQGVHTLVMNTVLEKGIEGRKIMHLNAEDVIKVANALKPERIVMTHFGTTMLQAKPWLVAKRLSQESGIEVIAAADGMAIELEK